MRLNHTFIAGLCILLVGCTGSSEPYTCTPDPIQNVTIVNLKQPVGLIITESVNNGSSGSWLSSEPTVSAIPSDKFILRLDAGIDAPNTSDLAAKAQTKNAWLSVKLWSMMNSLSPIGNANASCAAPTLQYASTHRLVDINITSDKGLNSDLPAGSPLTTAFTVTAFSKIAASQQNNSFLLAMDPLTVEQYIQSVPPVPLRINLQLAATVTEETAHTFTITYVLDSGSSFSEMSDPILITPAQ